MKLFENHEVNTGRQAFLDVAKSLSILFMVLVHVLLYIAIPEDAVGEVGGARFCYWLVDYVLGGTLAAPVFMFAMGVGVMYARASGPAKLMRRGGNLLWKGILLNILRCVPFALVLLFVTQSAASRDETYGQFMYELVQSDILPFAGLTFLLFAFLKRIGLSGGWVLAIAVGMSVLGTFCHGLAFGNGFADIAVSPFFGVSEEPAESCFPLFNWFVFPAAGMAFGTLLRRCASTDRLFALLTPVALVLYLPLTVWLAAHDSPWLTDEIVFYHMTFPEALYTLTGIFSVLGVSHFLSHILGARILSLAGETSRMINEIYIVHWLILVMLTAGLTHALGIRLGVYASQLVALVILAVSFHLARRWCRARKRKACAKRENKETK